MANLTRQEAKAQEFSDALQTSRQEMSLLRNENQQMKIEREVWKATESRIVKDNQDLAKERNALGDRLREIQHQLDDKDRIAVSERKRLEDRLEDTHKELKTSRKQLTDLMDEHRSMSARYELEGKELQSKIEHLSSSLERLKGELVLAQSKESTAAERVQELTSRLASTEEKLNIYEGRSISNTNSSNSPEDQIKTLELKISEYKFEAETLREELKLEKEKVNTFRGISQASEERLAEMNATYDVFKAEMEKQLEQAQEQLQALEKERDEIRERLNAAAQEVLTTQERMNLQGAENTAKVRSIEKTLEDAKLSEKRVSFSIFIPRH